MGEIRVVGPRFIQYLYQKIGENHHQWVGWFVYGPGGNPPSPYTRSIEFDRIGRPISLMLSEYDDSINLHYFHGSSTGWILDRRWDINTTTKETLYSDLLDCFNDYNSVLSHLEDFSLEEEFFGRQPCNR